MLKKSILITSIVALTFLSATSAFAQEVPVTMDSDGSIQKVTITSEYKVREKRSWGLLKNLPKILPEASKMVRK